MEMAEFEAEEGVDEAAPAVAEGNGGGPGRKTAAVNVNPADVEDSPLRRSLANGLSQRRLRDIISESARRYGSRTLLADDDDGGGGGGGGGSLAAPGSHLTQFLAEKQRISLSRERRAARTMAVVMSAFVLCWLPFFLMYVTMSFCASCQRNTDPRVVNFIVWLGYVNSTLNPLIYTVFNVDFRRAFAALLQPRYTCRRTVIV